MSAQHKVEEAKEEDLAWIKILWDENKNILGPSYFSLNAYKKERREKIIVIRGFAFARFLEKRDGIKTLYEIAVDKKMKRMGMASALLKEIGFPIVLKTDAECLESNSFYRALRFIPIGRKKTKSGKPLMIYARYE